MEWASKGTTALSETGQAQQAATYFTKALIETPHSPDYFTQRATAFSRFQPARHDLALQDAEYGVLLGQKRARREKIQAAQQRRVVALYGLGRHEDAKYVLDSMLKWRKKDDKKDKMEHDMWMAKINNKIKSEPSTGVNVKEYPEIKLPEEKAMKKWLQGQIQSDGTWRDFEDTGSSTAQSADTKESTEDMLSEKELAQAKVEVPKPAVKINQIRNDFFQNNDNLIITFYAKKIDPAKFVFEIGPRSVEISFPHPDDPSTRFEYSINPSFAIIDTSKSTYKVFGTKIELTLAKQEKGTKWPALQASDQPSVPKALPNPYNSKNKENIDWDKKAAELTRKAAQPKKTAEESKSDTGNPHSDHEEDDKANNSDDSDVGGDPVDSFFKQLYNRSDDDTKRAMMKSFQESNGTALSTNWSEVGKGKVEEVKSKKGE